MAGSIDNDRDDEIWDSMAVAHSEYWMQEDNKPLKKQLSTSQLNSLTQEQAEELLLEAGENGDTDSIRHIHSIFPSIINSRDSDGYTALHRAAYNGHKQAIELLLDCGADINNRTMDGWQPLHCACKWNKTSAVEVLLQNGADPNSQSAGGLTPLHMAASNNQSRDIMSILLMHSATDCNIVSSSCDTAHQVALRYGNLGYLFEIKEKCLDFSFH
ncbi:Ankyrin repeat domain-containing protein 49-like [Oopsacas minuta]|uniref:Ankyrin repeat domain-containing protein 49-like n=1 Tax=Oopsacas minuta TaxID=111878 RepID=A0AAV7JCF9_9METZ|nr:Ankyrin repeat domain-containing protein 49-like [Oopsacas minuta]